MSSPPKLNKPYQSRLFNFLNRQYLKLNSHIALRIRQLGYFVSIGCQTLLSPFYLIINNTKKLKQSSKNPLLEQPKKVITTSKIDIKPKNKLAYFWQFFKPIVITNNLRKLQEKRTQSTGETILKSNQRDDLAENQKKDSISISTTKLNYLKSVIVSLKKFKSSLFQHLPSSANLEKIVQESENKQLNNQDSQALEDKDRCTDSNLYLLIISAIDYFFHNSHQDDKLVRDSENEQSPSSFTLKQEQKKQLLISNKIEQSKKQVQAIVKVYSAQAQEFIPVVKNTALNLIDRGLNRFSITPENIIIEENNQNHPFQIQTLIWAAIAHFFQLNNQEKILDSHLNNRQDLSLPSEGKLILIDTEINTAWLSWKDLFGENIPVQLSPKMTSQASQTIKAITKTTQSPSELNRTNLENTSLGVIEDKQVLEVLNEEQREDIEAKVIEIRYEKHWLEIILEKVDQVMLWLEEWLIKIGQAIKSLMVREEQT